jgi:hypothetical protein
MFFQDCVPFLESVPQVVAIISPSLCATIVPHCFPSLCLLSFFVFRLLLLSPPPLSIPFFLFVSFLAFNPFSMLTPFTFLSPLTYAKRPYRFS